MKQNLAPTLFLLYLPKMNKYTRLAFFGILFAYPAYPEMIGKRRMTFVQLVDLRVLYARVTLAITATNFFHYLVNLLSRQVLSRQVPHDLRG